jgi:hypothetical protein
MSSPAPYIPAFGPVGRTRDHETANETASTRGLAPVLTSPNVLGYSQAAFEQLARESPRDLADIIRGSQARDSRLTFAAEILGRMVQTAMAADLLLVILRDHPSPLVREGAVLGLAHHLDRVGVRAALEHASANDPSPGVRRAASETLETD